MEQKQDKHGTIEQIKAIWRKWNAAYGLGFDATYAMSRIGVILVEEEKREHRLMEISEDARKDRELRDKGVPI